jgi:SagB-type dehydrogenase family enzyme
MKTYITNPSLDLLWINTNSIEGWIITSINSHTYLKLEQLNHLLVELIKFCKQERTYLEITQRFYSTFSLDKDTIHQLLEELLERRIIVLKGSELSISGWIRNYNVDYLDYSKPSAMLNDKQKMNSYLDNENVPSITENYPGDKIKLPLKDKRTSLDKAFSKNIYNKGNYSQTEFFNFLYYSFGALREAKFHDCMSVLLKFYPSNGARHLFELYIYITDVSVIDLPAGLYHYHCLKHELTYIEGLLDDFPNENLILVTAIFERMQWRYRNSWSYRDVLFEIGHLNEHIHLVSRAYSIPIDMYKSNNILQVNLKSFLDEETVIAYKF